MIDFDTICDFIKERCEDEAAALHDEAGDELWHDSADDSDDSGDLAFEGDHLSELKRMRAKVNWENEKERKKFFRQLYRLARDWRGQLPNLKEYFRAEEMDWLLAESVKYNVCNILEPDQFIEFAIKTGYRDEPELDEAGKPLLRRTTALHCAARCIFSDTVHDLFKIYASAEANYLDEADGLTHFHVACKFDCCDVVERFLESGQDPDCAASFAHPPLHLALASDNRRVVRLLLENGADPNLADVEGSTPLHVVCARSGDGTGCGDLAELFLEINEDIMGQPVLVDARDKSGRTPLQLAVANLRPEVIEILLDRGEADLAAFRFPTERQFAERKKPSDYKLFGFKLALAAAALNVVELLEQRGYKLQRNDALTVMKFFARFKLFEKPAAVDQDKRNWYDDKHFAVQSKRLMVGTSSSLRDLIHLGRLDHETRTTTKTAKQLPTFADYSRLARSNEFWTLPKESGQACTAHLCEIMSRRFFRRWTLEFFLELTRQKLPILCCEKIIEQLTSEDSLSICLAATGQNLK
ncbi:hypothetical protein TKK_0013230 [Trichogramma kaykai]|uniref:Uncharacterized protein n=1 Tax=Trichogramma kaykai TaxID=54128 RepID=A0ABD2WK57_9HYME